MENMGDSQIDSEDFYQGTDVLESFEICLENYNSHLVDKFIEVFRTEFSKDKKAKILDFGAGLGTLAEIWRIRNPNNSPICLEIDHRHRKVLEKRASTAPKS